MMAELLGRWAMEHPYAVIPSADKAGARQFADCTRHGGPMGADEIRKPLMGERQVDDDPFWAHPAPSLGQMPERQQQSFVGPLMMRDRQHDRQVVRPTGPTGEQFDAELRPRRHPLHQAVVEYRELGRLEYGPSHLGVDVRAVLVPVPGPEHVARAEQLNGATAKNVDLAAHQAVDDEKTAMVLVMLDRVRRIPRAGRQAANPGQCLTAGALDLRLVKQIGEIGVRINNADDIVHAANATHSINALKTG